MTWVQVSIPANDVVDKTATNFLQRVGKAFRAAGCPAGAKVFHLKSASEHIYYFSPALSQFAANAAKEIQLSAPSCSEPQNQAGLTEVHI
jgi:hypothetical protein